MKRSILKITALLSLVVTCLISMSYQNFPTDNDKHQSQAVIAEMNRCRQNPKEYAETVLRKRLECYVYDKIYIDSNGKRIKTKEGRGRVLEVIDELKGMDPIEPLAYDEGLANAARFHCSDIGPSGHTGHNSSDGTSMGDRLKRYVKDRMTMGENIDYGNSSAEDIVVSLVIDDGVSTRGHLKNIMNSSFRRAGVALGPHKKYKFMCVIDFSD